MQGHLDRGCTMGDSLLAAIQHAGDRLAFILVEQPVSFRALGRRLSAFIQALQACGVNAGDSVATWMNPTM